MFSSLSLKYRIAIIIFCLEAIMMAAVLHQTLGQSFEASRKQILSNEVAILDLVSGMSKSALITEEYAELQPYIVHLVSGTEVTNLFLTNANKTIVISSSLNNIGNQLPNLKERPDHSWQTTKIKNAAGLLGVLAIEFSNKALAIAYLKARDFGISIALVGMLIIAFIGVLVGFLLTRRLDNITHTAQLLANGDFSARTNIHGEDEIGKLASTFNKMVQRLIESKNELSNTLVTLKEKEQYLSITLHSIGDAVITTDEKGIVNRMNPVAETLTGWSQQEAQGQSLETIFPIVNASTREPIENPVDRVISEGEIIYLSNHTTLISKNGTEYQIADSAAPIRDNDHILGVVLVFNDVTEQYQLREKTASAQKLLMVKEKEQRDMLNSMVNAVISINETGEVLSFNKAAETLFDYSSSEIVGENVNQLMPEPHATQHNDYIKHYLQTNEAHVIGLGREVEGLRKNSETFPMRLLVAELPKDINGKRRFIGSCVDLTHSKQQEEQIRRSQKMDALGKLTGGIAHDYNNMLGVILGYSEMIETMVHEQPELTNYIHEVQHAGERGAKLTKKLLTFSRQKSSENKIVSMNTLLQDSQLMLEKTLTVRVRLVFELEKELWPINIDNSDLEDAILNLSINAMHAIKGNGQVTYETRNEVINEIDAQQLQIPAGDYVLLSITDTGCGMNNETKEKIFDPFYSTKGELGTGLGLSQVYGLVQRSKGSIKIYSEEGHGSRFTLYFPRYYDSTIEKKKLENGEVADLSGNQTILVVDDEPALAKLTSHILTQQGYKVFSANSGEEALLILEKESIDLLLSDVIMPEMDGYQLADIALKKYPNIKIQLASGFSDDRHINNTNSPLLHHELLHKPYHSKKLLQRVHGLLSGSQH